MDSTSGNSDSGSMGGTGSHGEQQTSAGGASSGGSSSGPTGGTSGAAASGASGSGSTGAPGAASPSGGAIAGSIGGGAGAAPGSTSTPTEQPKRPDDASTTAGGASLVAGDAQHDRPIDTGAANDPNSSHPASGDEGDYVEKVSGKAAK